MTPTLAQALAANTYPGRGIVVGRTPNGSHAALAYFLTGRSPSSRHRVLVEQDGAVYTRAVDQARPGTPPSQGQAQADPSLIIYAALRSRGATTVLTNGDQTDTIMTAMAAGLSAESALRTRQYEPDAPHFTSRISAVVYTRAFVQRYQLSQLRQWRGTTCRSFWEYEGVAGSGHLIHTYSGDGDPLPAFAGEPVEVAISDDQAVWTDQLWAALDPDNRISLLTRFIPLNGRAPLTRLINRYDPEAGEVLA